MAKNGSVCLFENCSERSDALKQHFQDVFSGFNCIEQEPTVHTYIGLNTYHKIHVAEELDDIMWLIRSKWYIIQEIMLSENVSVLANVISCREFINQAFKALIDSLLLIDNSSRKEKYINDLLKKLSIFLKSIVPISDLNSAVVSKITSLGVANCPYYQYIHAYLEIHYYTTILFYLCGLTIENTEKYLETLIKNVSVMSNASVKKQLNSTISLKTCHCVSQLWLTLQLVTEKIDVTGSLFWKIFNRVFEKESPLYSLCMLNQLALVQCVNNNFEDEGSRCDRVKSNYPFLETKMKELVIQADCDTLICSLKLIEPLLCDLWLKEGKIEFFQFMWDFYSKRLNISNRSSVKVTAVQFIQILDEILVSPKDCKEDFEMFLGLLHYHLNEYPMHWAKMKGRIYSQLGPNKVKDLSEIGIRHVMLLFLVLSAVSFQELEKKMLVFIENLPQEKKFSLIVWNIYSAIILKYVREGRSIEVVAPQMVYMLREASLNQKCFHLIKEFIKSFELIINNSLNMNLHQCVLLNFWLGKYQSLCYFADLTKCLEVVLLLIEKCSDADCWPVWENPFKQYVYVNLKQLSLAHNSPGIIGKIAGKIALLCPSLTSDAFNSFNSDSISSNVSSKFLEVILVNYPDNFILTPQQENIIVQSWAKICFLTLEAQVELSKNIIKLDLFPLELKHCVRDAADPMEAFIKYLGDHSQQPFEEIVGLLKICEIAFSDINKSLGQYIINPDREEIVLQIYHYVSEIFLNCSNLIYSRSKPVTILTKLVEVLLLPMDFMVGKRTPHNFVLNAIKHTWAVFFKAFMNLTAEKDSYIERILKDMVVKFIPYYSTCDSPVVNCLKDSDCATVILDKMYLAYFKPTTKETDANVLKALKIINDFVSTASSADVLRLIIKKTLRGLFEIVIFHNQRSTAIGAIKTLTSSPLFSQVRQEFNETVLAISDKNMGLNTINYFQLMICLAKFAPREIGDIMGDIKLQVVNVERLRGVGFDKTLRTHLEKLENAVQNNS